jgi:SAM-dependent methyltransferase
LLTLRCPAGVASLEVSTLDRLFFSNTLHSVPNSDNVLRTYVQVLDPGGSVLLVTPNVATVKNNLYRLLKNPVYRELRRFDQSRIQFVSIGSIRKWFATAELAIERVTWAATLRFESVVRYGNGLFGAVFGAEITVFGKRKGSKASEGGSRTRKGFAPSSTGRPRIPQMLKPDRLLDERARNAGGNRDHAH